MRGLINLTVLFLYDWRVSDSFYPIENVLSLYLELHKTNKGFISKNCTLFVSDKLSLGPMYAVVADWLPDWHCSLFSSNIEMFES